MNEQSTPRNTIVSVEHNSGTVFLVGDRTEGTRAEGTHVAGTADGGAWEKAGKEDIDPHGVARARDWKPSEVTFLTAHAADALERLIGAGRASTSEEAAQLYFSEHPRRFVQDEHA